MHVLAIIVILHHPRSVLKSNATSGVRTGTLLTLNYSPGTSASPAQGMAPATSQRIAKPKPTPTPKRSLVAQPDKSTPVSASTSASGGQNSLGSGDIRIALLDVFPTPKPDLSKLPHGVSGDIVLEIVIDDTGKITHLDKAKGIGYGIDEEVIATVQNWTFHPATKDGHPIASEQELHFHYEKA